MSLSLDLEHATVGSAISKYLGTSTSLDELIYAKKFNKHHLHTQQKTKGTEKHPVNETIGTCRQTD